MNSVFLNDYQDLSMTNQLIIDFVIMITIIYAIS